MYFILKENNFSVEVKVYKLLICNLLLNRNSLSYTILYSKYALHTWWPTVLWVLLELVLYLSMLSERFPCLVAACSEVSGINYDADIVWIWIICQIWLREIIWHWRDLGCAVCDRGYFSVLFTAFSTQDYSPFPVSFFIESCRNYFLYLSWNSFPAAYSHGLSASLKIAKTEPLACFTCGCFTFKAIIFPLKTFPFRLYSELIMSR